MRAAELVRLHAVALVEATDEGGVRVLAAHGLVPDDPTLPASADLIERAGVKTAAEQTEVGADPSHTVAAARLGSGAIVWGRRTPATPLDPHEMALLRELGEGADATRRSGSPTPGAGPDPAVWADPEGHPAHAVALARDGVIGLDASGTVVLFNPAASELFGVPASEAMGRPGDTALPHTARDLSPFDAATADGVPGLVELRRRDGSTFWAELWSGSIAAADGGVGRILMVRDVTDQRRRDDEREKLLQLEREQRFMAELSHMRAEFVSAVTSRLNTSFAEPDALLRGLPDLAIPVIADYAVCYPLLDAASSDAPFAALPGQGEGESPALPSLPALDWAERPEGRVIRGSEEAPDELRGFVAAHARTLGARSLALLPIEEGGRVHGVLLLSRTADLPEAQIRSDVELGRQLTQRAALVLANARLYREAKAAASLRDEVLAVVSHDLRNPLNVIALTTDAFLRHWPGNPQEMEQARTQVSVMKRAAERARRLVRDLLDVAQIEKGSLAVHPIRSDTGALLREACDLHHPLAEGNAIRLDLDVPEGLPAIEVDAERVLQVLGNLLDNALRHSSPGTTVRLGARADRDRVRIEIEDQGPGIAPEDADRLFERFSRGRRGAGMGAGLGLAIARGIVEAHGGALRFHNNDDAAGATFYFTLPIAR